MKTYLRLVLMAVVLVAIDCKEKKTMLTSPTSSRYKAGQTWSFKTPSGQELASLVILKIESHPKLGVIVHISLTGVSIPNPMVAGGVQRDIPHMPFAERAIDASVLKLVREDGALPDYQEGYHNWRQAFDSGQGGIFTITVAEGFDVIRKAVEGYAKNRPNREE